jgi:hypothetical protein
VDEQNGMASFPQEVIVQELKQKALAASALSHESIIPE